MSDDRTTHGEPTAKGERNTGGETTASDVPAASEPAGDWKWISDGTDGSAYLGLDTVSQSTVELRLLHRLTPFSDQTRSERRQQIESRIRLIGLTGHRCLRRVLRGDFDRQPGSLLMEIPTPLVAPMRTGQGRLSHVRKEWLRADRLTVASCLASAIASAHDVGLTTNRFTSDDVWVGDDASGSVLVCVDLTEVNCIRMAQTPRRNDNDSLTIILADLLRPLLQDNGDGLWEGRDLGRLRRWIGGEPDGRSGASELSPTAHQWLEWLAPWLPRGLKDTPVELDATLDPGATVAPPVTLGSVATQPTPKPVASADLPNPLGRFRLVEPIGEGGMGTVYRGIDLADGRAVAVKVLRASGGDLSRAVRRFRKEARLLADAQNDHVTRLIEVGEKEGRHFLAMELIEGIDLKSWFASRAPLAERQALQLVADIARALVDAHAREVVHRDIKPENVLLQWRSEADHEADPSQRPLTEFRVKLTDFGIARHVSQTSSMEMTQAGMLLGTPRYMAPEQFDGGDSVSPAADVYALGATLYELITGEPPFVAADLMKLATMHRQTPAPSVQTQRAEISDRTASLVAKMLAKDPAKRFGDASQLLSQIENVLHGEPISILAHPKSPPRAQRSVWDKTKVWNLASTPDQLWHLVSNTERLNHALGFPAVTYRTENDPNLGLRKFGSFRLAGLNIAWEEHPFEWIEGKRMGILREFQRGPFRWFLSVVSLEERPGGGTKLSHQVRIEPRNVIGRMLTTVEADWKGFKNLDRVYRRIDRAVQGRLDPSEGKDAFTRRESITASQRTRLDDRLGQVMEEGVPPTVVHALREVIAEWPSQEIAQLRPLQVANALGVDGQHMVDACLVAASKGLLQLRWDILCPTCRVPATTIERLADVTAHTACEACDVEFQSNVGSAIEMVFRVHPEIRDVNQSFYCIGGPEHSPHVVSQIRIEPQERMALPLNLDSGDYLLRGPRLPQTEMFRVRDRGAPSALDATLSDLGNSVHVPVLRRGQQTLTLTNDLATLHVVRVERMIPRDDVVTATAATTMSTFRRLFPHESFDSDNPVATEEVTLLATSLNDIDQLYATVGDTQAYQRTHTLALLVEEIATAEGGTMAKTMGEKCLVAFACRDRAVRAAERIRAQVESRSDPASPLADLRIGIAVHSGTTLVATENRRLDYFGTTVRAVTALAELAAEQTWLTETVFADPVVQPRWSGDRDQTIQTVTLPGVGETRVCRLA